MSGLKQFGSQSCWHKPAGCVLHSGFVPSEEQLEYHWNETLIKYKKVLANSSVRVIVIFLQDPQTNWQPLQSQAKTFCHWLLWKLLWLLVKQAWMRQLPVLTWMRCLVRWLWALIHWRLAKLRQVCWTRGERCYMCTYIFIKYKYCWKFFEEAV